MKMHVHRAIYLYLIQFCLYVLLHNPALAVAQGSDEAVDLWPEISPFKQDHLKVSKIHEIYYELCGNRRGKPVFVLHGGPGGESSAYMRRFFNPEKYLIVLHDQRGAGKSRPPAELKQNTTWQLVEDIERLRKHLKLKKIILFGGSWGSTLGLAYAEKYPENVSSLVLRGVFTATEAEIDHFYHGGVRNFFPEVYDAFLSSLPEPQKRPLPAYLFHLIQTGSPEAQKKYSRAWTEYEIKICKLEVPADYMKNLRKSFPDEKCYTFALLENYYMANGCFLEEGQLIRDLHKIKHIPVIIVNGRYDMICPPVTAYDLHRRLPASKLIIVENAGHWMGDKPLEKALLRVMKSME